MYVLNMVVGLFFFFSRLVFATLEMCVRTDHVCNNATMMGDETMNPIYLL